MGFTASALAISSRCFFATVRVSTRSQRWTRQARRAPAGRARCPRGTVPWGKTDGGRATSRFSRTVRSGMHRGVLVHDRDAQSRRLARVEPLDRLPLEDHRAGVGLDGAGRDVHERRLARAVLAEQGVHLAGQDLERDVGQGGHAGVALGDAGHGQRRDDGGRFGGLGVHRGLILRGGVLRRCGLPGRQLVLRPGRPVVKVGLLEQRSLVFCGHLGRQVDVARQVVTAR